jgi:hypothetical protein
MLATLGTRVRIYVRQSHLHAKMLMQGTSGDCRSDSQGAPCRLMAGPYPIVGHNPRPAKGNPLPAKCGFGASGRKIEILPAESAWMAGFLRRILRTAPAARRPHEVALCMQATTPGHLMAAPESPEPKLSWFQTAATWLEQFGRRRLDVPRP